MQEEALRSLEDPSPSSPVPGRPLRVPASQVPPPSSFVRTSSGSAASGASWLPVTQHMLSQAKALTLALLQSTFKSGGSQDS